MSKKFPLILRNLRKANHYTQKQLSQLLNLGQTTIANYENGSRVPDIYKLEQIADLFNVSLDSLIGRTNVNCEEHKLNSSVQTFDLDFVFEQYISYLLKGNKDKAIQICLSLLNTNMDTKIIYEYIIKPSFIKIGNLWERGEIDIWNEHFISEVSLDIITILHSKSRKKKETNKTIIGLTPGSEMHNIGLKMVCNIFESFGWHSLFLGTNLPTQSILKSINKTQADVVALSLTMPQNIESAKNIIGAIRKSHSKESLSIILGGSGFNEFNGINQLNGADYLFHDLEHLTLKINEL